MKFRSIKAPLIRFVHIIAASYLLSQPVYFLFLLKNDGGEEFQEKQSRQAYLAEDLSAMNLLIYIMIVSSGVLNLKMVKSRYYTGHEPQRRDLDEASPPVPGGFPSADGEYTRQKAGGYIILLTIKFLVFLIVWTPILSHKLCISLSRWSLAKDKRNLPISDFEVQGILWIRLYSGLFMYVLSVLIRYYREEYSNNFGTNIILRQQESGVAMSRNQQLVEQLLQPRQQVHEPIQEESKLDEVDHKQSPIPKYISRDHAQSAPQQDTFNRFGLDPVTSPVVVKKTGRSGIHDKESDQRQRQN